MFYEIEESAELAVTSEHHRLKLRRGRSNLVTENVVSVKTDHQKIGRTPRTQLFSVYQLACKLKFVVIGKWTRADEFVKSPFFTGPGRGFAQGITITVFPLLTKIFLSVFTVVEMLHPVGKVTTLLGCCDLNFGYGIDTVGDVVAKSGRS